MLFNTRNLHCAVIKNLVNLWSVSISLFMPLFNPMIYILTKKNHCLKAHIHAGKCFAGTELLPDKTIEIKYIIRTTAFQNKNLVSSNDFTFSEFQMEQINYANFSTNEKQLSGHNLNRFSVQ